MFQSSQKDLEEPAKVYQVRQLQGEISVLQTDIKDLRHDISEISGSINQIMINTTNLVTRKELEDFKKSIGVEVTKKINNSARKERNKLLGTIAGNLVLLVTNVIIFFLTLAKDR